MKTAKLLPLLLSIAATFQLNAQTIQGTLLFGSDPKEVILRIRNNSTSTVTGNVTKVQFTLGMYIGTATPWDALTFGSISTLPTPGTGSFSSSSFVSFASHYLATTWTGSKAVDLDPGEEIDLIGFSLAVSSNEDPDGFGTLRMQYEDPMIPTNQNWVVEVDGVDLAGGANRFYSSGPGVTVSNDIVSSFLNMTTFNETNLPVKLKTFEISREGKASHLTWATSEEINSDYFGIEHSQDAKAWKEVGRVESSGESKELHEYDFTHMSDTPGLHYYRLKMVDLDETFAYSKIVSVHIEDGEENAVYPNPAISAIAFKKELAPGAKVRILDTSGKVVYKSTHFNPSGTIQLDHLSSGQFFVEVEDSKTQVKRYKVIKK